MNREYHKSNSPQLARHMEMLVFGHAGVPVIVFPTSAARFYEFEDHGMIHALTGKIDAGQLQIFCVDSIDGQSWYDHKVHPRLRIARHMQYENYILHDVVPFIRQRNRNPRLVTAGCSFGGYHAVNLALRHPAIFTGFLSMSGAFDLTMFLHGYYDQDCYYHLPTHYLPRLQDAWFLERFRRNAFVLASGWDDQCLPQNQLLDRLLSEKNIPHQFYVWDTRNSHDWPTWQRMAQLYL